MSDEKPKKERVLHTRVPESLDSELRRRAERLGVSVSNLVRNVLNHAFGLVEDVITDSANVRRSVVGETPTRDAAGHLIETPAPTPPESLDDSTLDTILAWQRAVVQRQTPCARCGREISQGETAALAVRPTPGPPIFGCAVFLERADADCRNPQSS
ncbi:MAG: hypothetical protein ACI9MR_003812 [Myxococcota bacterium]|jgi:hypothetical protein